MRLIARLVAAVLLAFTMFVGAAPFAFAKDPIKIGFMAPYVGPLAKIGKDMENGFRLALEEAGNKSGDRQIVLVTEDDEAKPELGPTKARKLIENDKVNLIAGIIHSGVAVSIRDIVTNSKVPLVITNAGAPELTGKLKSPYIFRVSFANGQHDLPAGWYAYHKLGFRRMVLMATDYSAGHDKAEGFKKYFKSAGGEIVDEVYPPLSTTDFGPYLTKIAAKSKQIDGVWVFFSGSGSIRLVNQYQEYGLKGTVPLFVNGDTVDETTLPSMKEAAVGIKSYLHYAETIKTPENEAFFKAYLARFKEAPNSTAEQGYVGAKVVLMALAAVKGNIENQDAFLSAMRKVKFNAPRGPFSFDSDQNVILPVYARETRKVEGRYVNVMIEEIARNVDQNWSPPKVKK
jgi:branched-chain amino acid transport system substrate-binding protein